jgi:hypothetical protein
VRTVTEHLREHALLAAGCVDRKVMPDLESLRKTEWFPEFEHLMRNRLIMGAFRYGLLEHKAKTNYNMLAYLQEKVDMYVKTGCKEALVDIANMAGLEFMFPSHPNAHWTAWDDDSSHCQTLDRHHKP